MADFGNKHIGPNYGVGRAIYADYFTCAKDGTATSITVATKPKAGETNVKIKCAIYEKPSLRLIGYTETISLPDDSPLKWRKLKIVPGGTLEAKKEYYLAWWSSKDAYLYWHDQPGKVWQGQSTLPYNSFPDPLVPNFTRTGRRCSIYCTYTPAVEGAVNVYAVADSKEVKASFMVNRQGPYTTPYGPLSLAPGTYTFIGSYKGQTDKQTVTVTAGTNPDITFHFSVMHKLTIVSEPSPINFTFNTEAQSTPFVRELVSGTYPIVMPKSWMIGLDEYVFEQWENGSRKPTRTVTLASPQEVTLTATYRLRQIDEAGPINQRQMKDTLQEVVGQGGDLSPTNPLPTEDTGTHSNPEKFVQDHKFSSWPIDRAGAVATLLYGIASPAAHRRTAGLDITVWWIYFYNHSGGVATVWLESPAGTIISGTVQLADNQGVMLNVKPLDVGNQEIFVNASANLVQAQCGGIET